MLYVIVLILALFWSDITQAQTTSTVWSGYVVAGTITSVSAEWRVPWVTANTINPGVNQFLLNWTGIGGTGANSGNLVQAGTEEEVFANGIPSYSAWYELIPADLVMVGGTVLPGDIMSVSLVCTTNCTVNNAGTTWLITIQDVTQGWTVTETPTYASALSTGEAISEAPSIGNLHPLPNYGTTPFTGFTVNGSIPSLTSSNQYLLNNSTTGESSNASSASNGAFDTCWGIYNSYTPCSISGNFNFAYGTDIDGF